MMANGNHSLMLSPSGNRKRVSIIIPTYNKLQLTRQCLEAIRHNTAEGLYEVVVVDNGSTDGLAEFLRREQAAGNLRAVCNERNLGFAKACNLGAFASSCDYLLFLNNDTQVQPNWLEPLVFLLDSDPRVAIAGSKLIFPDNTIQHAGVVILRSPADPLLPHHVYCGLPSDLEAANRPFFYHAVTGACLFVRRSVFAEVGGFDEGFWNGYEDIDLCFEIHKRGGLIVYQPKSVVIHYEAQSGPERWKCVAGNIRRLHEKWLSEAKPDFIIESNGSSIDTGAGIIAHYAPPLHSQKRNGSLRISLSPRMEGMTFSEEDRRAGLGPVQKADELVVSAIVSTYNSERFIQGRLQDLVEQTLYSKGKLEIVVINSASQENEDAIILEFKNRYRNFKYIKTEQRESIYQAWNRGIKAASGRYITNANADDRLRKDALEVMASELDSHPDIALVYADVFVTNYPNHTFSSHIRCGYHIRPDFSPEIMLSGCHMGPQPMWRKNLHDELGYFDNNLKSAGDYEFWCRIALHHPMRHVNEFLGLYYENPAGICNSNIDMSVREASAVQRFYWNRFEPPAKSHTNNYQYTGNISNERFVNICMITFNRLEFTKSALESILRYTSFPHVITVVDNASSDGTRGYLEALHAKGIIKNLLLLKENAGVAKASNLGWRMENNAAFYLKYDNDIVIQKPDWLDKMVETLEQIPVLGAVAYNFEPVGYPLQAVNGINIRVKNSHLGGACIMIPKRTNAKLGYWCEDYGLYGEEDADYGIRIQLSGLFNAYMEDEHIGIHLPAGRAAHIDETSWIASDGVEEEQYCEYRKWKDTVRRKNVAEGGAFRRNILDYQRGLRSLYYAPRFDSGS